MKRVPPAGRPAGYDADDHLGHESDQPLTFQDVQACQLGLVDGVGLRAGVHVPGSLVLVAGAAANALVTARAEGPLAVLGAWPVAGQDHASDITTGAGMFQSPEQLINRVRTKGVQDVGTVEGDSNGAVLASPVVGQVSEILEAGDFLPSLLVEDLTDSLDRTHATRG